MKLPIKVGIGAALFWIVLKMIGLAVNFSVDDIKLFVFLNMFFLTAAISYSLFQIKRKEVESNLLNDIKNGMLAGVPYTLIVSIFLYFYYEKIYPEFNEKKIQEIELRLSNPKTVKEIQTSNPAMENKNPEEIKREVLSSTKAMYSAKFTMIISLLALMVYSTLNSMVIALIYRRVVFRN
jgi:cellobiose-specific phosphotransferase system component IIC